MRHVPTQVSANFLLLSLALDHCPVSLAISFQKGLLAADMADTKMMDGKALILEQQLENNQAIKFDPSERASLEKKLVRKVDLRMSILIIIYILNYIDRNNASAARSRGLVRDLGINDTQYQTLLSILYVGYILMQIPSNMLVQYTGRPSIYLPVCISIWGTISCLTGITHNFTGALLTRFFLGFVESAFFPGALYLLSKWYTRKELGLRTAILYCGSLASNAFGPLIAAGILDGMEGKLGHPAWRWLFYLEGAITVFIGLITIFILPDFPENSRGFTQAERDLAHLRMAEDSGMRDDESDETAFQSFWQVVKDYKVWVMALSLTAMVVSLSFNQFFPTLTGTLGYNRTVTLLLCAPPFGFATIVAFFNARHSDKVGERFWHIQWPLAMGIIGFIISMSTQVLAARYVSLFLMAASYAAFVVFLAWISSSFPRPPMRRAVAIAFINAFSQLGNISGAYVFPLKWGPTYQKSYGICIACFVACSIGVVIHRFTLRRLNRKLKVRDAEVDDYPGKGNSRETSMVHHGFRYVI